MINALRGMKDIIDEDSKLYMYVLKHCKRIAKNYGFSFIQTPILEETALFKRSVGASSDIVGKEMYQFIDKGGNDVCMRPEGTAGVVRAFIQKKKDRSLGVHKYFYYGAMYRYERPQKGRFRQFHQFGIESFGEADVKEDVSVILVLKEIFDFFKIKYTLKINSIGCEVCMPPYREKLVKFLDTKEGLCEDCQRRKLINPIRTLDCKNEHCQTLLTDAPQLLDNLCFTCKEDFEELKRLLSLCGLRYEVDSRLVRGLDYYTKTAFEFISDELGAQGSIAGGGRYDKLVEFLDGKPTCGVGFGLGLERLMDLVKVPDEKREGFYMGALCQEALSDVFLLGTKKRKDEKVSIDYTKRSLKAHLKQADKKNALFCACIGEDELAKKTVWIKNLETQKEWTLSFKEFGEVSCSDMV